MPSLVWRKKFYMSPDLVLSKALCCSVKHTVTISVLHDDTGCMCFKQRKMLSLVNNQERVKT